MQIKKVHFKTIHSTNSWAKENINTFDQKAFTVVSAEEQMKGRGRFTRAWVSPRGSLYRTYVFYIPGLDLIANVPQLLALKACTVIADWIPQTKIKWPNDLVVDNRKVAGILCEVVESKPGWFCIIGIGININMDEETLASIDRPAASLQSLTGGMIAVDQVADQLDRSFYQALLAYLNHGFTPFLKHFRSNVLHIPGEKLKVHLFPEIIQGRFVRIDDDGTLVLKMEDGKERNFTSGELYPNTNF